MGKKLIGILLTAVMLFGVFGLVGCGNVRLDAYKVIKSKELQEYADAKGEDNYCADGWQSICKAVTDGKKAIDEATTKPAVDVAVMMAKEKIMGVDALEEKIIWNGTIAYIIDNETIIITIDKNFNAKQFTANDFKMLDIVDESFAWLTKTAYDEHVKTGTFPEGFRHIIIFKVVDKGPQNLIDAIRLIEKINFVHSVGPNSLDSPDD